MPGSRAIEDLVDNVIDGAVAAGRVVGAVVLVRENGALIYQRAAGHADREAGIPMTVDAVFRIASLTKPLVAAAALALVEAGKLGLDDEIAGFLPDFRPRLEDGSEPAITVRHLLTHTAGFGYPAAPSEPPGADTEMPVDRYWRADVSSGLDQPGLSLDENLRRIASVPLYFSPGSGWRYGVATDVLGAVVAEVRGTSLADAVAELVTGPLDMVDTGFTVLDPNRLAVPYADGMPAAERMADPQTIQGFTFSPSRAFDGRSFQSGGAGMVGTAGDFVKFLEAIRQGGAPILRSETVAAATNNQVGALREEDPSSQDPGWGFGFMSAVLVDPGAAGTPQSAGTLAWGGLWGHWWFIDPRLGLSVVCCTNTAVEGCTGKFPVEVRDALYLARGSAR